MRLIGSILVLIIGLNLSYIFTEKLDDYGSLSVEALETFLFSIISYLIAIFGFVYSVINIDKIILNSKSRGKFFIIYNVLKFILGVVLIILGFVSLYATFASSSVIWGVIFTLSFFASGIHIILSVIRLIKL